MDFRASDVALSSVEQDCLVVGVFQEERIDKLLIKLDKNFPVDFAAQIGESCLYSGFKGKSGQVVMLPTLDQLTCKQLVLMGLGKADDYSTSVTRKAAANLSRRFAATDMLTSLCIYMRAKDNPADHVQAAVEGWVLGSHSFRKYKSASENNGESRIQGVTISGTGLSGRALSSALQRGKIIAEATNFARALIAEPACFMTPSRLAQEAKRLAKTYGISCKVFDLPQIEEMQMGCLAGVARGAKEPPKFIVMKYAPAKSKKTIALVGKGITFDSGGLSLKSAQNMEHMKYDMSGAAAVLATMQVMSILKPPLTVLGVIAATENMPGGNAIHPGDVLKSKAGKTIEVNNTDAEGRLVLSDALAYACEQDPDEIIDIATLTGACVTALGRVAAGIMGNNQALVQKVIDAGARAGEKLWQLPLFDEYRDHLKSDIADLKNAGSRGEAGSSCAGMFLKEFVGNFPWAHLDIAGPGWLDKDKEENNKGGTAFGVRTLSYYLLGQ